MLKAIIKENIPARIDKERIKNLLIQISVINSLIFNSSVETFPPDPNSMVFKLKIIYVVIIYQLILFVCLSFKPFNSFK